MILQTFMIIWILVLASMKRASSTKLYLILKMHHPKEFIEKTLVSLTNWEMLAKKSRLYAKAKEAYKKSCEKKLF